LLVRPEQSVTGLARNRERRVALLATIAFTVTTAVTGLLSGASHAAAGRRSAGVATSAGVAGAA
jgi:hypothetical protein